MGVTEAEKEGAPAARRERILLLLILIAAAALRFGGIAHGAFTDPFDTDETNNFLEPIGRMWRLRTADPTVYSGYPGFFNWIAFLPVGLGRYLAYRTGALTAARGVIATFGVFNVWLIYRLCRKTNVSAALFAAALLAFSRGDVRSAHFITPDVMVTTGSLILLNVLAGNATARRWVLAGVVTGMTIAVKYTGLLLAPPLVIALATARDRWRSVATLVLAGLLAFAVTAPYALKGAKRPNMGMGFEHSIGHYYGQDASERVLEGKVFSFGSVASSFDGNLGTLGMLLAVASFVLFRPLRTLLPAAAIVVATIVVMSPANMIYPRHVLPATAALAYLAAAGLSGLSTRLGPQRYGNVIATAIALIALAGPALRATALTARFIQPTPTEQAVAWLNNAAAKPLLVGTTLERLTVDEERVEVRFSDSLTRFPAAALPQYDYFVAPPEAADPSLGLTMIQRFCESEAPPLCTVALFQPSRGEGLHRAPSPSTVISNGDLEHTGEAFDSDATTAWPGGAGDSWIEARWSKAITVSRIDIEVDEREASWPQDLGFESVGDDGTRTPISVFPIRPTAPERQRQGAAHGQAYVLISPVSLTRLRVTRSEGPAWELSEISVLVNAPSELGKP